MPTSNGQITSRDLRKEIIKTPHIRDEQVTTGKIPDLAITFPDKIDDPIWVDVAYDIALLNESLTTTPQTFDGPTLTVPAWVDNISVLFIGTFQMTNSSGGNQNAIMDVDLDGSEAGGGVTFTLANNATNNFTLSQVASLNGVSGSTVTSKMDAWLSTGTNSSNFGVMSIIGIGTR